MNVADSEVVASVLNQAGYEMADKYEDADYIFLNTCSIRENAEQRVFGRLDLFNQQKLKSPWIKVGVLGCMAERLKEELMERKKVVDLVVGPDGYRDLPDLLAKTDSGNKAINVILSQDETYDDISPVRYDSNGVSGFISIMRGCQNFCSYCIVPYVRGKERSRNPETILHEMKEMQDKGFKEVTLIGQNVNSYLYKEVEEITFDKLLVLVANNFPDMRIRFSTNHPKDLSDEVLKAMADHNNICRSIHLPVQAGSSRVLKLMNRAYTREWYLDRIRAIRKFVPDCAISTDIMVGFCGETDEDHEQTLSLMEEVQYDFAFMFKYSNRPGTFASKNMTDDVPEDVKVKRLNEVIELQSRISAETKTKDIGKEFEVLVEGVSKKSENEMFGRNSQNKVIVFPRMNYKPGDFVRVKVEKATSATLIGKIV